MTSNQQALVKYAGALFGVPLGGYLPEVEDLFNSLDGNLALTMRVLSEAPVWTNAHVGDDATLAQYLVDQLVLDTVGPEDKQWATDWFVSQREAGLSWGEIVLTACSALEQVTDGRWAVAGDQFRARSAYLEDATNGWAATCTDAGTLLDAYSYAIGRAVTVPQPGAPNIVPVEVLSTLNDEFLAALPTLTTNQGVQAHTLSAQDTGRVLLLGAGDDTLTMDLGTIGLPAFVSGGDGFDTLVLSYTPAPTLADFLNQYYGLFSVQPFRGFERLEVPPTVNTPKYMGSIQGLHEIAIASAPGSSINLEFGSPDNGTTFELDVTAGGLNSVRFFALPPYNDYTVFAAAPGGEAQAPQLVSEMTFKILAGTDGNINLVNPRATHLTVDVDSSVGGNSNFSLSFGNPASFAFPVFADLKVLTYSTDINARQSLWLKAPVEMLDLTGSTGHVAIDLRPNGPTVNDGVLDAITVKLPQELLAFNWQADGVTHFVDSYVEFDGELQAGSRAEVYYNGGFINVDRPTIKAEFDSDFSELSYFHDLPGVTSITGQGFGYDLAGSIFDVRGAGDAAVYFHGLAPQGQTIGNVILTYGYQQTLVKVDGANGINLVVDWNEANGITTILNTGAGSVLDLEKESLESELGKSLTVLNVAGGRIFWADQNGNAQLDGLILGDEPHAQYPHSPDFILFETTNDNLATFNQSVQALGFNPVIDVFL